VAFFFWSQYRGAWLEVDYTMIDRVTPTHPHTGKKHPHPQEWQDLRRVMLMTDGRRCSHCHRKAETLDLHHRSYFRWGNEEPADVEVLCRDCHEAFHREWIHRRPERRAA
jgi:hypothetical protein